MNNDTQKTADPTEESHRCALRVIKGMHQGAEIDVLEDALIMVGASDHNDVQLLDGNIADYHCVISTQSSVCMIRAIDQKVTVDDQIIQPGEQAKVLSSCDITLTPLVTLHFDNQLPVQEIVVDNPKKELSIPKVWSMALVLFVIGVVGVVSTSFATILDRPDTLSNQLFDNTEQLQTMLQELSLTEAVASKKLKNNRWELSGVLKNSEDIIALRKAAKKNSIDIVFRVSTADQLMAQVSDVFRTNGLNPVLQYHGDGLIEVTNLHASEPGVDRVIHHAKQDIFGLKKLTFSGSSKAIVKPGLQSIGDIDKKLTVIVGSNVSYLATADDTRYFVGSVLPGGYKIESISAKGVLVVLGNENTLLSF